MKRILIFSLAYFPKPVGGAEVAIKEITDRIPDIEFHLITQRLESDVPQEERIANVMVHRVGGGSSYLEKMLFIPRATALALRLHSALHFDGAWSVMSYMALPLVLMRILGTRLPYVITLQEGDSFDRVYGRLHIRIIMPLLRSAFRNAAAVQAISTFLAPWAPRLGFTGEALVIPNGVDTAHFGQDYPETAIREIQDSLGKRMGDVFLVTTSRLVHKNALDDVIRALPSLPANVHFVILGTGPDEEMLKKLAADLHVENRVRFLGQVGHDEMPKFLVACDIFIRPSRTEGLGNSFIEAMAAGVPVIATQEGGLVDIIFDEKRNPGIPVTAWAVDKDSPQDIAAAVTRIMEQPEKARAVIASARAIAAEKYDWNLIAKAMWEKVFSVIFDD